MLLQLLSVTNQLKILFRSHNIFGRQISHHLPVDSPHAVCVMHHGSTVMETNKHLKLLSGPLCNIHYWGHRGFWNDLHCLGQDGVHLLCTPDVVSRRSIRNAVMLLSKFLRQVLFIIMIMLTRLHVFTIFFFGIWIIPISC